jgi:serine/threonine protein kinase
MRHDKDVVENETRAIKICMSREHPNIVTILHYGRLSSDHFYIDMELCAINLDDYIYDTSSARSKVQNEANCEGISPVFVPNECSFQLQLQNVYTIMSQISDGVKFLHMEKLAHRDLKPSNGTSYRST